MQCNTAVNILVVYIRIYCKNYLVGSKETVNKEDYMQNEALSVR